MDALMSLGFDSITYFLLVVVVLLVVDDVCGKCVLNTQTTKESQQHYAPPSPKCVQLQSVKYLL
jgi:hypothetical protein